MVLLSRFRELYAAIEDYLAGTLLFTGLSLIFINVVMRYFFSRPQSILDEFSVYFVVWGTLIGIAVALRNDHHIKVDILFNALNPKVKRRVSIVANSLGLAFAIFYTYFGFDLVFKYVESGQKSTDSQFPLWIVYLIMPLSGLLFSARFIEKIYLILKGGLSVWAEAEAEGGRH